jgi:hypothetical protein
VRRGEAEDGSEKADEGCLDVLHSKLRGDGRWVGGEGREGVGAEGFVARCSAVPDVAEVFAPSGSAAGENGQIPRKQGEERRKRKGLLPMLVDEVVHNLLLVPHDMHNDSPSLPKPPQRLDVFLPIHHSSSTRNHPSLRSFLQQFL